MSNLNLKRLKEQFSINTQEASKFILALLTLEDGEKLDSSIGMIQKVDEHTFNFDVKPSHVRSLVSNLESTHLSPKSLLFNDRPY